MAPAVEGAVISAEGVKVQEAVFEDLRGIALVVEVIDQGEALGDGAFHDVSPDPVGGPELVFEGVGGFDHESAILLSEADDRPGPWRPWPPDRTERVVWEGRPGQPSIEV